ncbi:MAG: hypothetical protein AB2990_04965 [Candidatus Symbiodolus clandestinus]
MSKLTEIKISFQERNLEKFKNQVRNLPKDGKLVLGEAPTYEEWVFFLVEVHKNYEENKEYIAALRESPDETVGRNLKLLDQKSAGIRVASKLIQNLVDVEIAAGGRCNPDENYTMNMPPLVIGGQDRIHLREGGIAMLMNFFSRI